jgi:TonB family protein
MILRVLISSAALAVITGAGAAAGPTLPSGFAVYRVRCQVVDGPAVGACEVVSPIGLDEVEIGALKQIASRSPACRVRHHKSGETAELSITLSKAALDKPLATPGNTRPDWAEIPDSTVMAAAYPASARGKTGKVFLHCRVPLSGTPADCTVVSETPTGLGFGKAALHMSQDFCWRPAFVDGKAVDTGTMDVPLAFRKP